MNLQRSLFALLALGGTVAGNAQGLLPQGIRQWRVYDAEFSAFFHYDVLKDMGMEISGIQRTAPSPQLIEGDITFASTKETQLNFQTKQYGMEKYLSGSLKFAGGFDLTVGGEKIPFRNFEVSPTGEAKDSPVKMFVYYKGETIEFDIANASTEYQPKIDGLVIGAGDILVSRSLAERMGQPWLVGRAIGGMHMQGYAKMTAGLNLPVPTPPNVGGRRAAYDIKLMSISGVTAVGTSGTWPAGQRALAFQTVSCNPGTVAIPWDAAETSINATITKTNHPKIVQNFYRVANGRFEQIGEGWLKHGFFALNNTSTCGPCTPSGTGALLGVGCSDPYGSGNNSDRGYLAPKSEVNPLTGVWTVEKSFFTGYQNDRIRRSNGSSKWNGSSSASYSYPALENRIVVDNADLNVPGATYYYEGFYIIESDIDHSNNVAYRQFNVASSNGAFSEASPATVQGTPAISVWGDERANVTPSTDGQAIVAVATTDMGGGRTKYEYAAYCYTVDRGFRSFKVPLEAGLTLTNVAVRDPDKDAANNWTWTYGGGNLTFSGQTFAANPNANNLSYSRVFNFSFEVNAAPATGRTIAMDYFKPGTVSGVTAKIKAPRATPQVAVSGIVTFTGGANRSTVPGTFKLIPLDANTTGSILTGPISINGTTGAYSFNTDVRGNFRLLIQADLWLDKSAGNFNITAAGISSAGVNVQYLGDTDGDNEIGPADFDSIVAGFGSATGGPGWNPNNDLDGDGEVGPSDFDLVVVNFGRSGDN